MNYIDEAKKKMAEECLKNELLIPLEEHLTELCTTDAVAQQILVKDKSLQKAFNKIKENARKVAKNGCAYVPEKEVFRQLEEYFEIEAAPDNSVIDISDFL